MQRVEAVKDAFWHLKSSVFKSNRGSYSFWLNVDMKTISKWRFLIGNLYKNFNKDPASPSLDSSLCISFANKNIYFPVIRVLAVSNSVRKLEWKTFSQALCRGKPTHHHTYKSLSAHFFLRLWLFSITPVTQMNDGRYWMKASIYFTSSLQFKVCLSPTFSFSTI